MNQAALFGVEHLQSGDDLDFYVTPRNAFEALESVLPYSAFGWSILEPAAGVGTLLGWALEALPVESAWAIEVHEGRFAHLQQRFAGKTFSLTQGDFLRDTGTLASDWRLRRRAAHLVLMNPPYSKPRATIGMEFVERALEISPPDGVVAAMLPLAFASTKLRAERVHRRWQGSVYPLTFRPDCGGEYGGGSRDFAWFVWDLAHPKNEWRPVG